METYKSFRLPKEVREHLPTIDQLRIFKMPTTPKRITRMVRVPHQEATVFAVDAGGWVYGCPVKNVSQRVLTRYGARRLDELEALSRLGVVPESEVNLLKRFAEEIHDVWQRQQAIEGAIGMLERSDIEPPPALLDMKPETKEAPPAEMWLDEALKGEGGES